MKIRAGFLAIIVMTIMVAVAILPAATAQMSNGNHGKPLLSPPAVATVQLDGKQINIHYNTPFMRGRKIFGGLVPYDKVWRTGANPATTLKTDATLRVGTVVVPAGTYTIYTLPSEGVWKLIINKQTGQWGTVYNQSQDLARIDMMKRMLPKAQEKMSISFENTHGNKTQLHVRWDTTDVWVPVVATASTATQIGAFVVGP